MILNEVLNYKRHSADTSVEAAMLKGVVAEAHGGGLSI